MAESTEDFEVFLQQIVHKLVVRLIAAEGSEVTLLHQVNMTARLIRHLKSHQRLLVTHGVNRIEGVLLGQLLNLGQQPIRPHTWKEIGEALGISAQAAHRKYAMKTSKHEQED